MSGSLLQYCSDKPDSKPFKFKSRFRNNTYDDDTVDTEIAVPLKYLDKFYRTLQIPLINCKINLILTWTAHCVIWKADRATIVETTYTKLYVPVVTLSTQDNAKLNLSKPVIGINISQMWKKYLKIHT